MPINWPLILPLSSIFSVPAASQWPGKCVSFAGKVHDAPGRHQKPINLSELCAVLLRDWQTGPVRVVLVQFSRNDTTRQRPPGGERFLKFWILNQKFDLYVKSPTKSKKKKKVTKKWNGTLLNKKNSVETFSYCTAFQLPSGAYQKSLLSHCTS